LPGSALHERLDRELDSQRAHGHDLPQTAKAYVADWLANRGPHSSRAESWRRSLICSPTMRLRILIDSRLCSSGSKSTRRPACIFVNCLYPVWTPSGLRAGLAPSPILSGRFVQPRKRVIFLHCAVLRFRPTGSGYEFSASTCAVGWEDSAILRVLSMRL
jgi:hypothetical protein